MSLIDLVPPKMKYTEVRLAPRLVAHEDIEKKTIEFLKKNRAIEVIPSGRSREAEVEHLGVHDKEHGKTVRRLKGF